MRTVPAPVWDEPTASAELVRLHALVTRMLHEVEACVNMESSTEVMWAQIERAVLTMARMRGGMTWWQPKAGETKR